MEMPNGHSEMVDADVRCQPNGFKYEILGSISVADRRLVEELAKRGQVVKLTRGNVSFDVTCDRRFTPVPTQDGKACFSIGVEGECDPE